VLMIVASQQVCRSVHRRGGLIGSITVGLSPRCVHPLRLSLRRIKCGLFSFSSTLYTTESSLLLQSFPSPYRSNRLRGRGEGATHMQQPGGVMHPCYIAQLARTKAVGDHESSKGVMIWTI
jgi:hypothetical protein